MIRKATIETTHCYSQNLITITRGSQVYEVLATSFS